MTLPNETPKPREAIAKSDWKWFGHAVEEEALNMRLECVYDKETGKPKPLPYI